MPRTALPRCQLYPAWRPPSSSSSPPEPIVHVDQAAGAAAAAGSTGTAGAPHRAATAIAARAALAALAALAAVAAPNLRPAAAVTSAQPDAEVPADVEAAPVGIRCLSDVLRVAARLASGPPAASASVKTRGPCQALALHRGYSAEISVTTVSSRPGFEATVKLGSACYDIRVENPLHRCRGIWCAVLNGTPISCAEGRVRVPLNAGRHHLQIAI